MSISYRWGGWRHRRGKFGWRAAVPFALVVALMGPTATHPQPAGAQDGGAGPEGSADGTAPPIAVVPPTSGPPAGTAVPAPAAADAPVPPGPSTETDGSALDAAPPPPPTNTDVPPAPSEPTDPAALAPLPGYTGGGTLVGDNRLPAGARPLPALAAPPATPSPSPGLALIPSPAADAPVMVLAPAAAAPLEAEVADATGRHDQAVARLGEARAAAADTRGRLDRLEADLAGTTDKLGRAEAAESLARDTLSRTAVAWYIGDMQPLDLSAELFDEGARTVRARKEVVAEAALDRRLTLLDEAERAADGVRTRRAELQGRITDTHGELTARAAAVATAEEGLGRVGAELAERQGRLDGLLARTDPAVEGLPGADTAGVTFPVAGPFEFLDSWGFPRSGGRRHRGSDVFAPGGTPLVAIEAGVARADADALGGLVVYLTGESGTAYYYAHLQAIEPAVVAAGPGGHRLQAGERLGLVGDTGNAVGGAPHLHLQTAPAGGDWDNPYPLLARLAGAVVAVRARAPAPTG